MVNIPGNTFEDTSISTCIVVLKKNKITTDIVFEDGDKTETVSREIVEENDYSLSVSIYIPEEIEREYIDPSVLENEARRSFLIRLKKELDFDKMVCEMEGISIKPFISAIRKILREYDRDKTNSCDNNQISLFDVGL